ncbi:MAG TPA: preprotein translocase subunit YajC [Longimicrobium sp.]|nr:preprotein translocase subunit YajC [Longimicrobium sp.]
METATLMLAQAQGANPILSFVPILAMLAIFYFILIVPQRRQLKAHQAMVAALKKGDQVVTAGGLIGEITGIKDDTVQVRTGQAVVVVERGRIVRVINAPGAAPVEK